MSDIDTLYEEIGIRIGMLRTNRKMTQEELGNLIGVTRQTVNYWESARRRITLVDCIRLCELFECDMNYLIHGDDSDGYKNKEKSYVGKYIGLSPDAMDSARNIIDYTVRDYEAQLYVADEMCILPEVRHSRSLINYLLVNYSDGLYAILQDLESVLCAHAHYETKHRDRIDEIDDETQYFAQLYRFQRKVTDYIESIDYVRFEYETFYKYDYPDTRLYTLEEYRSDFC